MQFRIIAFFADWNHNFSPNPRTKHQSLSWLVSVSLKRRRPAYRPKYLDIVLSETVLPSQRDLPPCEPHGQCPQTSTDPQWANHFSVGACLVVAALAYEITVEKGVKLADIRWSPPLRLLFIGWSCLLPVMLTLSALIPYSYCRCRYHVGGFYVRVELNSCDNRESDYTVIWMD